MSLTFTVIGEPAPQGSKSFMGMRGGHAVLAESSKKVKPWRISVEWAAREAMCGQMLPIAGPASVTMTFYLRRPKSAPKRVKLPFRLPDLDKLVRSTLDAITIAGVIEDDARVVRINAWKVFADSACVDGLNVPGAIITVSEVQTP